jgi:tetratricopeptide (TPR) repeat protein
MADLSLKRFLEELAQSLAELSDGDVRAVLLRYAAAVVPGARQQFLENLQAAIDAWSEEGTRGEDGAGEPPGEDGEGLLAAIDALAVDLAAGVYFDGYDWDPYERRERAFGDESWAPRMDALFDRANAVFLRGDLAQARDAYARLFEALAMETDEGGPFSGDEAPTGMLRTDVAEAAARYLRTIYQASADPAGRARELGQAWLERLPPGCAPHSLTAVRETLPHDLLGLVDFRPYWTAYLTERMAAMEPLGYGLRLAGSSLLHELATEAALAGGGTDALGQVARAGGALQAEAYLTWIDALRGDGRVADAEQACREALEAVPSVRDFTAHRWAVIAERAAFLAQGRGDATAACRYRERAWELAPDVQRLCALFTAAERHRPGSGPAAAALLAERRRTDCRPADVWGADHLTAQALLLADRLDDALELLPARVDDPGDVSETVLPYVLAAASGAAQRSEWPSTVLHALVLTQGEDRCGSPPPTPEEGVPTPRLGTLLCQLLAQRKPDTAQRERWLHAARAGVGLFTKRIVGGQQRRSYDRAARLATACAEALICAGEDRFYLESVRGAYPRHVAFRREVDTAQAKSPLV